MVFTRFPEKGFGRHPDAYTPKNTQRWASQTGKAWRSTLCKILKAVFAAFSFRLPLLPAPVGTAVQLLRVLLFALFLDK